MYYNGKVTQIRKKKMNNNYEIQQLECVECGKSFVFSTEDQEFYAKKGYSSPKRCPDCRAKRKAQNNNRGGYRERRY